MLNPVEMPPGPSNDDEIACDALLAGLSQAIPIPLFDDEIETLMQKRMIRHIFAAHRLSVSDADIQLLQRPGGPGGAKRAVNSMAFITFKRLLKRIAIKIVQKTTIVLDAKVISDTFSRTYTMGYLLDLAVRQQWLRQRSLQQIRAAIDVVCSETDTSPVNRAVAKVFRESKGLLASVRNYMLGVLISKPVARDTPEQRLAPLPADAMSWVEKIQTALDLMPTAYYAALADRFAAELGVNRQNEGQTETKGSSTHLCGVGR
jgi:hypothetical protein